jgi:hypothetical protein
MGPVQRKEYLYFNQQKGKVSWCIALLLKFVADVFPFSRSTMLLTQQDSLFKRCLSHLVSNARLLVVMNFVAL